jgi:hypothetical protein
MLAAIFIFLIVIGSAASVGSFLPRKLSEDLYPSEAFALRLLAGLGLLGLTLFLVGNWLWNKPVVWAVLLLPIAARFVFALRHPDRLAGWKRGLVFPKPDGWLILCTAIILLHAVSGLAIPVGDAGNDAISYHFLGPVIWQRTNVVRPVLDHSHTAFPENIEMLFGAGMILGNERVPGLIGTAFAALLLVQIGGLTRRLGGKPATASLAMAVAATMPVIMDTAEVGFVDIPYAALCLAAARLAFSSACIQSAVLAGLFAGLAAGTKYTGLMNLVLIAIVSVVCAATRAPTMQRLRNVAIMSCAAVVLCSPWYLRNAVQLGTPIYPPPPVLSRFVHAKAFPVEAAQSFQDYILERGKGYGRGPLELALLPYNLTYRPAAFHGAGGIGMVSFAFMPIAFAVVRRNKIAIAWMVWSTLFTVAWFLTQQEARFFVPVLAVAASFGAIGAAHLWDQRLSITRILTAGVIGLSLVYGLLTDLRTGRERMASVFSKQVEARREAAIPAREAFQFLNSAPDVEKVLVLNRFVPCYYLRKPYIKVRGPYWEQPIPDVAGPQAALLQIHTMHVTHILDVQGLFGTSFELNQIPNPNPLVFSSPDARIYKVVNP